MIIINYKILIKINNINLIMMIILIVNNVETLGV